VGALFYGVASIVSWAVRPGRRRILKPASQTGAIAVTAWLAAFSVIFFTEALGGGAGEVIVGVAAFGLVIGGAFFAARVMPHGGAIVSGLIIAGAVWMFFLGNYSAHAVGWQDLSLEDFRTLDNGRGASFLWLTAMLATPEAFVLGFFVGLISPHVVWRRPPGAAAEG
jgi:hypothetical protein